VDSKRTRILIGKLGLDGHDRGAKVLALTLRDAGMEVIYPGLRQTARSIIEIAIEEDVNVICLSFMAGTHVIFTSKTMRLLEERGIKGRVKVLVGGTIPQKDIAQLKEIGVAEVFPVGSSAKEVVEYILKDCKKKS
jgi:methylmalonyl-CoA mutase C-terminal domain/subunit